MATEKLLSTSFCSLIYDIFYSFNINTIYKIKVNGEILCDFTLHTRTHVIIEQIYLAKKKKQIQPLPIKIISRYYIIPVKDNK